MLTQLLHVLITHIIMSKLVYRCKHIHTCTHTYAKYSSVKWNRHPWSITLVWALHKHIATKNRNAPIVNMGFNWRLWTFKGTWMKFKSEHCLDRRWTGSWSLLWMTPGKSCESAAHASVSECVVGEWGVLISTCCINWFITKVPHLFIYLYLKCLYSKTMLQANDHTFLFYWAFF